MRQQPKGAARLEIEAVLMATTLETPVTAAEIAERTGVSPSLVTTHMGHMKRAGDVRNMDESGRKGSRYAWVRDTKPAIEPRRHIPVGNYTCPELRPFDLRTGSNDAFTKPSVVSGESVPRVRPMIVGASAVTLRL